MSMSVEACRVQIPCLSLSSLSTGATEKIIQHLTVTLLISLYDSWLLLHGWMDQWVNGMNGMNDDH